jgi:hypothetical protein
LSCKDAGTDGGTTDTGDNSGGDPINGFTTIAAFKTWLDAQPTNTAAAPYNVKVNIANLGGSSSTVGSLGNELDSIYNKYINLDLSGSPLTSIGDGAFRSCNSLTGITIPNGVTSIGDNAFAYCTSLTSITIPNGVTSIGNSAFDYCTGLTSVTIPAGVTSIGQGAFGDCASLTAINVDPANSAYTSQDGVLYNKDKTTLHTYPKGKTGAFTIPNGVTSIGNYAFRSCNSLTSVTIPNSVTSIGNMAFFSTSLTSVTFASTISSSNFSIYNVFYGDLRDKYLAGGTGTYTRSGSGSTAVWTRS